MEWVALILFLFSVVLLSKGYRDGWILSIAGNTLVAFSGILSGHWSLVCIGGLFAVSGCVGFHSWKNKRLVDSKHLRTIVGKASRYDKLLDHLQRIRKGSS